VAAYQYIYDIAPDDHREDLIDDVGSGIDFQYRIMRRITD
jgi:hypothetical protein